MLAAGFTINLLTLLGIVLSVGLVVDDAIVMVENIERHLQEGKRPFDAAIHGARELVGPIVAMTITRRSRGCCRRAGSTVASMPCGRATCGRGPGR